MYSLLAVPVWDKIIEFFSEISGFTHFVNRVWTAVSGFFDFLGDRLMAGVDAFTSFMTSIARILGFSVFLSGLVPPFVVAWIHVFIIATLASLAISIILELL